MRNDFAVFIITHGRPDTQLTYKTLQDYGYCGKLYFVLDDTDNTIQQYIDNFGTDKIFVFNKNHYINDSEFDNGTNTAIYACALYARRAVEDIAKSIGLSYFCVLDDDVVEFALRQEIDGKLKRMAPTNFTEVLDGYIELLSCENISCLGFCNQMFYFGGLKNFLAEHRTLPYQGFIRKVSEPVKWACWYGEDAVAGYDSNIRGKIWMGVPFIMIRCAPEKTGAMSKTYQQTSTLLRAFAEYRYHPSELKIAMCTRGLLKGDYRVYIKNKDWYPKLVSSRYKKCYVDNT